MQWVTQSWGNYDYGYNTKKSAFWRVVRQVVDKLGIADIESSEWPSHLIWSNLYKFAPANGGNPCTSLSSIQFNECKSLIETEIRIYLPKRILFLAGINWAEPFIKGLVVDVKTIDDYHFIEGTCMLNSSYRGHGRVVVAVHPQGKNEDIWVEEVVNAFAVKEI